METIGSFRKGSKLRSFPWKFRGSNRREAANRVICHATRFENMVHVMQLFRATCSSCSTSASPSEDETWRAVTSARTTDGGEIKSMFGCI